MAKKKKAVRKKAVKKKAVKRKASKRATKKSAPAADFGAAAANMSTAWNTSRKKAPQTGRRGPADIPDGDFLFRLTTARCGVYRTGNSAGVPYFKTVCVCIAGPYEGEQVETMDDVSPEPLSEKTETTKMDLLSERLQRLGLDISEMDLSQLPDLAKALADPESEIGQPVFVGHVKNTFREGNDGVERHYQNLYVNEMVPYDEVETIQEQFANAEPEGE